MGVDGVGGNGSRGRTSHWWSGRPACHDGSPADIFFSADGSSKNLAMNGEMAGRRPTPPVTHWPKGPRHYWMLYSQLRERAAVHFSYVVLPFRMFLDPGLLRAADAAQAIDGD